MKKPRFKKEELDRLEAGHEVKKKSTPTESTESISKTRGIGYFKGPEKPMKTGKTTK